MSWQMSTAEELLFTGRVTGKMLALEVVATSDEVAKGLGTGECVELTLQAPAITLELHILSDDSASGLLLFATGTASPAAGSTRGS